jgi:hypothetical protein
VNSCPQVLFWSSYPTNDTRRVTVNRHEHLLIRKGVEHQHT